MGARSRSTSLTDSGRTELERLIRSGLEEVSTVDRTAFSAAICLLPLLSPARALRSLTRRRTALEQVVADLGTPVGPEAAPPHALRMVTLWLDLAIAEPGLAARDDRAGSGAGTCRSTRPRGRRRPTIPAGR
ncbi:hypothetical protein [Nocardioides convexus]|uniref:hypothetical protein n=1 Tax=Nocardioides convexus TaxID=2712224 RepID=UPI0024186162|nr:hypothetical protein [Nocardioides convexus]